MISSIGGQAGSQNYLKKKKQKEKKKKKTDLPQFEEADLDISIPFLATKPNVKVEAFGLGQNLVQSEDETKQEYISRLVSETLLTTEQNETIKEFVSAIEPDVSNSKLLDMIKILTSACNNPRPASQQIELAKSFINSLKAAHMNITLITAVIEGLTRLFKVSVIAATALRSRLPVPSQLNEVNESLIYQIKLQLTLYKSLPKQFPLDNKLISQLIRQLTALYKSTRREDIRASGLDCFKTLTSYLTKNNDNRQENLLHLLSFYEEMEEGNSSHKRSFVILKEKLNTYFSI